MPDTSSAPVVAGLFIDLVNSTALHRDERLGRNQPARDAAFGKHIKRPFDAAVEVAVKQAGGWIVNPAGDAWCCALPEPQQAVECGLALQHRLKSLLRRTPVGQVLARVGLHFGSAGPDPKRYIDQAGNVAARVQGHAPEGGVAVSAAVRELCADGITGVSFRSLGPKDIKGLGNQEVFVVECSPRTAKKLSEEWTKAAESGNSQQISASAVSPEVDALLRPYRDYLVGQFRFLPMRGIRRDERHKHGDPQRIADDPDQRLELERIFVELDTTRQIELKQPADKSGRGRGTGRSALDPREREEKTRPLPALEAVATGGSRHVVLHGAPGCGKSTLVRFLLLALAHCGLGEERKWLKRLPAWPAGEARLLPFRIELRHFAVWLKIRQIQDAAPCHLWNHIKDVLAELQAKELWPDLLTAIEQLARAGQAIFLLDGLDEVPGGAGKLFVRDCIEEFARGEIGKCCRIVVTCRTRSYDADYKERTLHLFESKPSSDGRKLALAGPRSSLPVSGATGGPSTSAFELKPFDEPKKKRFIAAWYDALTKPQDTGSDDPDLFTPEEARARAEALQTAVCDPRNDRLGKLAENPLLLTVIAHLHSSQRDLKLPDNRAELFHDLIDLLLTRWAERHQPKAGSASTSPTVETLGELLRDPGVSNLKLEHLLQLIAELAHDHYRGGQAETLILIPEATLRKKLIAKHRDPDTEKGAAWAEKVMNFIQFRAGLLNSPDGGENYDFPHSLLGEYLAAYHLCLDRAYPRIAAKVTADGNWDEVIRLVAGHYVFVESYTRGAVKLVEELCGPAANATAQEAVTDLEWRRVALAADILHEMGSYHLGQEQGTDPPCRDLVCRLLVRLVQRGALPARDRARAATILGELGDPRLGVGVKGGLPEFHWLELPGGEFELGEEPGRRVNVSAFRLSQYPVTVGQFRAFLDDREGYDDPRWWETTEDAPGMFDWWRKNHAEGPENYDAVFQTPNHPRVGVCWFEAVAFCRWATNRLRSPRTDPPSALGAEDRPSLSSTEEIRLPHENQWEWAARCNMATATVFSLKDRPYPWGGPKGGEDERAHLREHCNWSGTGLGHTSAVGLFPTGAATCGAMDLSGNVWEWCENWSDENARQFRALRGGSWIYYDPEYLSCSCRYEIGRPEFRDGSVGFRVVCVDGWSR